MSVFTSLITVIPAQAGIQGLGCSEGLDTDLHIHRHSGVGRNPGFGGMLDPGLRRDDEVNIRTTKWSSG